MKNKFLLRSHRLILVFWTTFCVLLCSLPSVAVADATTADGFLKELREAITQKDAARLASLFAPSKGSEADKADQNILEKAVFEDGLGEVSLQPLPSEFMPVQVRFGKRLEYENLPRGYVEVKIDENSKVFFPYAIIGGRYFIVYPRSTDIGWTGPSDRYHTVIIQGNGQNDVHIRAKWNASGESQEMNHPGVATLYLIGQYIEEVEVVSAKEDSDIQVTIKEENRKEPLFVSDRLIGKGTIRFKKGS